MQGTTTNRRALLGSVCALGPLAALRRLLARAGVATGPLGICAFSCHQHWRAVAAGHEGTRFADTAGFFRYARELGADGIQAPLRGSDPAALRALVEECAGYYEASLRLPDADGGTDAFDRELRHAREAGAEVARTILMGGRRYEVFKSLEDFRTFHRQAKRTLERIEPLARKRRLRIAVENHKDLVSEELVALMESLSSEWIGVLVDTGNNLSLLEDPDDTVAALAPYAQSVHLKDMAVQPDAGGFLLSETPLGTGMIDLVATVAALRRARPGIAVNLEMATRDPLRVPCLDDGYYATFPERRATHLAPALERVSANPPRGPVPAVAGKPLDRVLAEEEENNRRGLGWMRRELPSPPEA